MAKAYNKTEAQIALRWLVQQGLIAIPRTATPEKMRLNIDIFDFKLCLMGRWLKSARWRAGRPDHHAAAVTEMGYLTDHAVSRRQRRHIPILGLGTWELQRS